MSFLGGFSGLAPMAPILPPIDVNRFANDFLKYYYETIHKNGWNGTLSAYSDTCTVVANGVTYKPFDMVCDLAKHGIAYGVPADIFASWKTLDSDNVQITVTGTITFMSFTHHYLRKSIFVDTFVLSASQCKIVDHTMHVRDHFY
jgi:hypothetical protein